MMSVSGFQPESFLAAARGSTAAWVRRFAWLTLLSATGILLREELVRAHLPEGVKLSRDIVYRRVDGQRLCLDIYEPEITPSTATKPLAPRPAILAIHGGGWRGGSKADFGRSLIPLVQEGYVVIAADYRLSRPGKPSWPGNLDDLKSALGWVRRYADDWRIDRDRITLAGASAGGHLALLLGETATDRFGRPTVKAVIDFYGPTDLIELRQSQPLTIPSTDLMIGGTPSDDPEAFAAAAPRTKIAPTHPPTFLLHGNGDRVVPVSQSTKYAERLTETGVFHRVRILDGERHGFGLQAGSVNLVPEILDFLRGTDR